MAYGIIQKFIWTGSVRRPAPAQLRTSSDYGKQVTAQTLVLVKYLQDYDAQLSHWNNNTARTADSLEKLAKNLNDLIVSVGTNAVSINEKNAIVASFFANQLQHDNFFKEVNAGKPTFPPLKEQITSLVKDAVTFNGITVAEGFIVSYVNKSIVTLSTWITETSVYKTVTGWIKEVTDLFTKTFAKSAASIKSILESLVGKKASS